MPVMRRKLFHVSLAEKKEITESIRAFLENRPETVFAYLHGSFVTDDRFKDIDIAVYLDPLPSSLLQAELGLEAELGDAIKKYPVDIRILNNAPLSFRYNVIKYGRPIVGMENDTRCDFVEATFSNYFDFAPFRENYLKEVLGI
jgi:predicted nucleotidyltransferase